MSPTISRAAWLGTARTSACISMTSTIDVSSMTSRSQSSGLSSQRQVYNCLWFDGNADEAANFYASLFPDSHIDAVHRAPSDYPSGKTGGVLMVEFTLMGQPFTGLNG